MNINHVEVAHFLQATSCHFTQEKFTLALSPLHIVSITGSSGSGKTTILSSLYAHLAQYHTVAFVAADTELPLSGTGHDYIEMIYASGVGINTIDYAYLLAQKMNILSLLSKDVNNLSLGQAHRLLVLQALCINVSYIILDEPYANISSEDAVNLNNALGVAVEQKQQAIIISEHETPCHSAFPYRTYDIKDYVHFY